MKVNGLFLQAMKNLFTTVSFFFVFLFVCYSQINKKSNAFVLLSYNTENFFDTVFHANMKDHDFNPGSKKHWDSKRYQHKTEGIARVISEVVAGGYPDIIVLCEVENREVLNDLVQRKEIASADYRIIFEKSQDHRGINTGLLYQKKSFRPISQNLISIEYPGEKKESARGILYVAGIAMKNDTLHIFANHWKSRVGSQAETESKRMYYAHVLKNKTDSILSMNSHAKIICLGDFNDEPGNNSIRKVLEAGCIAGEAENEKLVDVMCPLFLEGKGTYSYRGKWQMLDNIILSKSLVSPSNRLHLDGPSGEVYAPSWLLKYNDKAGDSVPWKTYAGNKYLGGYSDHLPVYVELVKSKNRIRK